jgi:hypothetical protein
VQDIGFGLGAGDRMKGLSVLERAKADDPRFEGDELERHGLTLADGELARYQKSSRCVSVGIVTQEKRLIQTSKAGWLESLAKAYKAREAVVLEDDAQIGIDPKSDTLLRMALKAKLSPRELAALGAWVIVMAVLDPEPYTKVVSTIVAGGALVLGGGFFAIRILTDIRPPHVRVGPKGFEIYWD